MDECLRVGIKELIDECEDVELLQLILSMLSTEKEDAAI